MKKAIVITLVISTVLAIGVYIKVKKSHQTHAKSVEVTQVKKAKIIQKVNATGKIQPKTKINISADVSAKITQLYVKEGDWVKKGTLLVELDREKYLATVESQQATVKASQANAQLVKENMQQAKRVWTRAKEMFSKKLNSQAELDVASAAYQVEVARYDSALQQVEQSKGNLKRALDDLSKTTIYAPMSGTISKLNKEVGEIAIGSQFQEDVIMTIADLRQMEALVNVDENDITAIKLGQDADIDVDALSDQSIKGKVSDIATSANENGANSANQKTEFSVTISITDANNHLRPGMTASANIITAIRDDALSVPIQSVTVRTAAQLSAHQTDKKQPFQADKDGFVELVFVKKGDHVIAQPVKTGIQSNDLIEILSGLKVNDTIVSGNYRAISRDLTNGDQVKLAKPANNAKVN